MINLISKKKKKRVLKDAMRLAERHVIKINSDFGRALDRINFLAKNLYNSALYAIKNHIKNTGKYISYAKLDKLLRETKQPDYCALPSAIAQQVLMDVDRDYNAYFRAKEEYKKNPKKFNGTPRVPRYKDKMGRAVATYTNIRVSKKNLALNYAPVSAVFSTHEYRNWIKMGVRISPGVLN